ncbi:MAG: HypC/HybG/HupF family hydrogenase formation chaperone [Planctomycetes bacterium]|nr:HypC/HybG/HupF family hydrogenase formation chaperone [Planctomycetota bacterium]
MCLAVPGQVVERWADRAVVDFQGNRAEVSLQLTPEAMERDWVLVHAGFAITRIEERDALETWAYLRQIPAAEVDDAAGMPATDEVPHDAKR